MDYLSFLLPLVLPQLYQTGGSSHYLLSAGSSHNLLGIVVPPVLVPPPMRVSGQFYLAYRLPATRMILGINSLRLV